ncbi:MAG TPA: OmpA family protein [Pedococcus sp.]|jgi:outer membrane protein OmpA-like peptidoglycan-associated protein|nr:OmpA family protein [Pedococcus sp.]
MTEMAEVLESFGAAVESGSADKVLACVGDAHLDLVLDGEPLAIAGAQRRRALDALLSGFEDLAVRPVSRAVSGSVVRQDTVVSGRHAGAFAGAPPTGQRVHVNVRLVATAGPSGTLDRLTVEPDVRALFAQTTDSRDAMGTATALIATARDNQAAPMRIFDIDAAARPAPSAVPAPGRSRRKLAGVAALTAALVVGAAAATAWGVKGHSPATTTAIATSAVAQRPSATRSTASAAPKTAIGAPPLRAAVLPAIAKPAAASVPKVQSGKQLVLASDVLFALDSSDLTGVATTALDRLGQQIRDGAVHGTIQINGYTDNAGTMASNARLSMARALAVARVLQQALAGLPVLLQPQGFGESGPVASNANPAGQARNRRVTVVLPAG